MTEELQLRLSLLAGNMKRMAAAYRLRLAMRARQLNAEPQIWGGDPIVIEKEQSLLLDEDKHRIEPYPYPGLRSFEPGEGEIFFGRSHNVEEVREKLAANQVVAVLGGSGSGKSSLLRAGLLPFLNTKQRIRGSVGNWYSAEFRPRTRPLDELASALAEQIMLPRLKTGAAGLAQELGLPPEVSDSQAAACLRERYVSRFVAAGPGGDGSESLLDAFTDIAEHELDRVDNAVTGGRRLGEPSLFLLIDQLEEAFRPEVCASERDALLNLIVGLHEAAKSRKGRVFLALTMRSEEVHRCAEHRGLSAVVVGSGYQLELLDPDNLKDREDLRLAIVRPARNVFADWGLRGWLQRKDADADEQGQARAAPFAPGMPDLLLAAAGRLSKELEHRPDQLPLLQHALQATWHTAMKRWSRGVERLEDLQITLDDLPGYHADGQVLDLGECLNLRADDACDEAAAKFANAAASAGTTKVEGEQALTAAFRALARIDDIGNWVRRFAGRQDITVFLNAEKNSPLARMGDELRWTALEDALNSFLVRGYLNGGRTRDYDISHEALIRNWRKFQLWLRDPREVAYSLGRVLREVKEPDKFANLSDKAKVDLIPQAVAGRVAMVAAEGQLPTRWGEDQIAPILRNLPTRKLWGSSASEALAKVIELGKLADQARRDLESAEYMKEVHAEQEKLRAEQERFQAEQERVQAEQKALEERIRAARERAQLRGKIAMLIGALGVIGVGWLGYGYLQHVWNREAKNQAEMRRITALARDALWSEGPATAILIESRVDKVGLKHAPEAERLLLTSLHEQREQTLAHMDHQMVNGIAYSPAGDALVSSDPNGLVFSDPKEGQQIGRIDLSDLADELSKANKTFNPPLFGVQWSPGPTGVVAFSRDQALLIAPCSREPLKRYFDACADKDHDIVQVLGDGANRVGAAKFSADGKWMASGGFGAPLQIWDLASSSAQPVAAKANGSTIIPPYPNAFAISSDGRTIAAGLGQSKGEILVFDRSSPGAPEKTLGVGNALHGNLVAIAFNPADSRMLGASTTDGSIFVWDDWRRGGDPIKLEKTRGSAFQIVFSRDGEYLVAANDDGALRMWSTKDGEADQRWQEFGELRGHGTPVWAVAVSPDGRQIASGGTDGSIITWSARSAFDLDAAREPSAAGNSPSAPANADKSSCPEDLALPPKLEVAACAVSPNGRLVVAFKNGRIEVFDQESDAYVKVDDYQGPPDVAAIRIAGDRLIVEHRSGEKIDWPFFDSLSDVIHRSLGHDPISVNGNERNPLTLSKELRCRIDEQDPDCESQSSSFIERP